MNLTQNIVMNRIPDKWPPAEGDKDLSLFLRYVCVFFESFDRR